MYIVSRLVVFYQNPDEKRRAQERCQDADGHLLRRVHAPGEHVRPDHDDGADDAGEEDGVLVPGSHRHPGQMGGDQADEAHHADLAHHHSDGDGGQHDDHQLEPFHRQAHLPGLVLS